MVHRRADVPCTHRVPTVTIEDSTWKLQEEQLVSMCRLCAVTHVYHAD